MMQILSYGFAAGMVSVFIPRILMLPAVLFRNLIKK